MNALPTDFNDLSAEYGAVAVRECIDSAREPRHTQPESLRRPVPPSDPYPISELGPILRPACEAIVRVMQPPPAIVGASLLAAASLAVQGLVDMVIHGRRFPVTLWFVSVAESGERKSAVDAEATRAAREYEKELVAEFVDAMQAFEESSRAEKHIHLQSSCEKPAPMP